jgi:membrane-associated phospholipid phosphatase
MFEYRMSSSRRAAETGPSTRPHAIAQAVAPVRRPRIIGELLVVVVLLWAYDMVRGHAEVREVSALRHGQQLLDVERFLHINIELSANLWTTQKTALSLMASYWYQFAHLTVTLGVLIWCWWRRAHSYRRVRNALVLTNVFGLAIFLLYPAAPPRFLPGFGFVDAVANAGFGPTHGGPVTADQFGAFPSLHLAWAVWTAVVAFRLVGSRTLRWLWLCYPVVTAVAVVVTGNHYLLDILAGGAIALTTLGIAHHIPSRRSDDRHRLGSGSSHPVNLARCKTFLGSRDGELVPSSPDR